MMLSKPSELVLDTHAIKILLLEKGEVRERFIRLVREECHTLVIPNLRPEIKARIGIETFGQLVAHLATQLKGKFLVLKPPKRRAFDESRECLKGTKRRASRMDILIAATAYDRARKTGKPVVIVSNDPAFHQATCLRRLKIHVEAVDAFKTGSEGSRHHRSRG